MRSRCVASLDRERHLDAPEEVALHPVGAGAVELGLAAVAEVAHARMLEEAADDRAHADVLRHARHSRPQRADAAHDEVDLHAGARRVVQRLDDLRFDQRVHACATMRAVAPVARMLGLARDQLQQRCVQRERRLQQLPAACGVRVRLVSCRKISCTSRPMASSQVSSP